MNEIGKNFKETRLAASVSIEEASADTEIPSTALEQIEEGNIGSFKDIFKLKDYLRIYAKYLGLDGDKIIDEFNEYLFEYTSKIPIADLEKKIAEKEQEEILKETQEIRAVTPYLRPQKKNDRTKVVITAIVIIILVALAIIWAIKQVTVG